MGSRASHAAAVMNCQSLRENVDRAHWLTLPLSRLVVNPTLVADPHKPEAFAPSLPMNLAYYAGETPVALSDFWTWQPMTGGQPRSHITFGPAADFSPASTAQWQADRARVAFQDNRMHLTVAQPPFGSLTTWVNVNLDETPLLSIQVPDTDGTWALKVNAGNDPVDTYLVHDRLQGGNVIVDVRSLTKWRGRKSFKIILFAIGNPGTTVVVSQLRFFSAHNPSPSFRVKATNWFPHQIISQAEVSQADTPEVMKVESTVCMADEATVTQHLRVEQGPTQNLVLTGQLPTGKVRWDAQNNAIILQADRFQAVVAFNRAARWMGVFPSRLDWLAGDVAPTATGGFWALAFDGVKAGDEIVVAARFAPVPGDVAGTLDAVSGLANPDSSREAVRQREAIWNRTLNDLPHPSNFQLHGLASKGATAQSMRRMYYKAWIFLLSNSLPPMPENGYSFPQLPCGKASLWSEGAPHARASSQWESMIAMQFVALVDPATAWSAYKGMMSLVQPDGALPGEGLPSRHAQTAWVLYSLTADKENLRTVYPALKRLLLWKIANPRWIYKGATPPDQKDAEFVVHALMDALFASRIAKALQLPGEDGFWQAQVEELSANYHRWFWDKSGARAYRIYYDLTGKQEEADRSRNLQSLVLPATLLKQPEKETLLKIFRASLHHDIAFLVPELAGFPKYNYTLRGIWQYGSPQEASSMAQASVREITLAGEFSENYYQDFPPRPTGVTPSVFGAAQILDGSLWHNGIIVGDGLPIVAHLPHATGVENLRLRGEPIDIRFQELDEVELQGSGLQLLRLPFGFKAASTPAGTPLWRGTLPVGQQLVLEEAENL